MQNIDRLALRLAALTIPFALVACGGGGSDAPTEAPPPGPQALAISGTAATGAAIAAGQVDAKCAAGTGSATTGADGSFTVSVDGGSLPCVLRVTSGSTELYSVAEGSGSEARANITPLSQLVAAQVAGGDPAALYGNFDASAQAKVSASAVAAAVDQVGGALAGTVDLAGANPLTTTFAVGDAFDQQLDALQAALASAQVTLDDVSSALVSNPGTAAPVQTLLQPAVASCSGMRSGKYRALDPNENDPEWNAQLLTVDAAALTVTEHDGSVIPLVDKGSCLFETADGALQLMVSKSGVTVARDLSSGPNEIDVAVVLPEQALPLAELAGTWNAVAYLRDAPGTPLKPSTMTFTLDAAGHVTAGADCLGMSACTAWAALPANAVAVNADGGYDLTTGDGTPMRLFAYKTADGQLSMYLMPPAGSGFAVAAPQRALSLPAVGTVNKFWDFTVNGAGFASALSDSETTVLAVDAASASFTRQRTSDGRVDGFTLDAPRVGLRHRDASPSGATVPYSEIISLPLPGTGLTVSASVASNQNFLNVSIAHP